MIRRTEDYSLFSDKELSKIARAVNKSESKQLFDMFDNPDDARIASKELKVKGFDAEVAQAGEKWKVYIITPEKISLKEAEASGAFKKLAWGRYCFNRNSSLEMHEYPFDDGSIWKIAVDEDGNHVLVKEIDDKDDEIVLRKTAGLMKTAEQVVNDVNFNNALKLVFTINTLNPMGEEFLSSLFEGTLKPQIIELLNGSLDKYIDDYISSKGTIEPEKEEELKGIINNKLTGGEFVSLNDINSLIDQYFQEESSLEDGNIDNQTETL